MRETATFEAGALPPGTAEGGTIDQLPNLRHLRAFQRVVELRSVNRAAASVHLSQPAVSQAIMRLEEAFATPLLIRYQTGVVPTEAGAILSARVERALGLLAQGTQSAIGATGSPGAAPPDLSPAQLNALIALQFTGDPELAARSMGITSSSLLRNLRLLEDRLDTPVVLRDGARILLTEAARRLGRAVRLALRELELAREEIAWQRGQARGRITLGAMPMTRSYIAPKTLVTVAMRYPQIQTEIVEGPYETLLQGLRDGRLDILVGALRDPAPGEDVVQTPLFDEELCVVAGAGHPLTAKGALSLGQLFDFPWVQPREHSPAREEFEHLRQMVGREPPITFEVASHMAVRSILLESPALALLSRHQITYEHRDGQLVVLPVRWNQYRRTIGYTLRRGWQPTAAQVEFLTILRAVCDSLPKRPAD